MYLFIVKNMNHFNNILKEKENYVDYCSIKILLYLLFIWRGMLWYVNHNSTWPLVVFNVNKILFEFLSAPRAVLYNWLYQIWLKSHAILTLNIYTEFFGIFLISVLAAVTAGGEEHWEVAWHGLVFIFIIKWSHSLDGEDH